MELGPGVIILLITWLCTGLTWIVFLRSQTKVRIIITTVAALLTVSLVLVPTESKGVKKLETSDENYHVYDYLFIWKVILIIILCLSIFAALGIIITITWTQKIHGSQPISRPKPLEWSNDLSGRNSFEKSTHTPSPGSALEEGTEVAI